jgi:hypothetical protein
MSLGWRYMSEILRIGTISKEEHTNSFLYKEMPAFCSPFSPISPEFETLSLIKTFVREGKEDKKNTFPP